MNKMKFFDSGYPRIKSFDKKDYIIHKKNKNASEHKFIAFSIDSDFIKDKIGGTFDYRGKHFTHEPIIKKIFIYAETLTLKENMWIPEAYIEIHVNNLNMNGYSIISSGLPYNPNTVSYSDTNNGRNGRHAGNIKIVVNNILTEGSIIAYGTNGEWIYVPDVEVEHPKYRTEIKFHILEGCSDVKGIEQHFTREDLYNRKIVSLDYNTVSRLAVGSDNYCRRREKIDPFVDWVTTNDRPTSPSETKDSKRGKRLTFNPYKPGKGGDAGKIIVHSKIYDETLLMKSQPGNSGFYRARKNSEHYDCKETEKGKCISVIFKEETYSHLYIYGESTIWGNVSSHGKWGNIFSVPSWLDKRNYFNKINLKNPNKNGNDQTSVIKNGQSSIHPEMVIFYTSYLKEQFSIFLKKTPNEKKELANESNSVASSFESISTSFDFRNEDDLKSKFQTARAEIIALSEMKSKNLDEFNNPPGYRPLLSMVSTLAYLEKNLEDDLYLYVFTDKAARLEGKIGDLKKELPKMIERLYKVNNVLSHKLGEINVAIDKLSSNAKTCKEQTEEINNKIKELKKKYEKEATEEQKKLAWYKTGLKVCALAANVIPYGQPILGQVLGNTLDSVAEQIGSQGTVNPYTIMEKIDMTGIMEKMSKKTMVKSNLESADSYELELNVMYETDDVTKITIDQNVANHKSKLAKYKKKVDESKARWAKAGNGLKDIMADYGSFTVSKDEIQKQLSIIMTNSADAQELFSQLHVQMDLKAEIFSSFQDNMQKSLDINNKIFINSDQIKNLTLLGMSAEADYIPELEEFMGQMKKSARERLNWIEYQLVKIYEYSQLNPYNKDASLASNEVLDKIYSRIPISKDTSVNEIVAKLKPAFQEQVRGMSHNIVKNISLGHKQDPKKDTQSGHKFGRYIMLDNEISPDFFEKLNSSDASTFIDLQKDLLGVIVLPNQENARIIDISLNDITFDQVLPKGSESVKIKIELGSEGVLRSGKSFYIFNTEKEGVSCDSWSWTIKNITGQENEVINESELSDDYKALLKFVLGENQGNIKPGENENIFTLPPAWNRLKVSVSYPGFSTQKLPKITSLSLNVRLDYQEISTDSNTKVLDVRLKNALKGTVFNVKVKEGSESSDNFYNTFSRNEKITIDLKEIQYSEELGKKIFKKWIMIPKLLDDDALRQKSITFSLKNNVRLIASFEENIPKSTKPYFIYASPYKGEEPITEVSSRNEFKVLEEDYKNGFSRIIYGMQEAFVEL
ncbi:MAG: Unknown protein [uncultured Sulfurovum sp.]|uniref:Uncharacterized protein n=1 Tax=uncultured Sulfurovum sp. TaxID=269237 RepID=A0A6S6SDE0_9BACT|nr:MAG: Unknown protein [uncultured Sulfurovum sp.]